jgi:hypothetical protein
VLSGTAAVFCVHDRQKRLVRTESDVARIGLEAGLVFDRRQHRIHRCACCENLFVDPSDEPRFCTVCVRPLVHPLGGPLPQPIGEVDG